MARNAENTKRLQKEWYEQNKDLTKERAKDWVQKNTEKRKEVARNYARSNPKKLKNNSLKSLYGITLKEFENKRSLQQHRCAICDNEFKSTKDAHMDHCHTSGKVRDILCGACNKGLGHFKDSVQTILSAAQYLIKHQS